MEEYGPIHCTSTASKRLLYYSYIFFTSNSPAIFAYCFSSSSFLARIDPCPFSPALILSRSIVFIFLSLPLLRPSHPLLLFQPLSLPPWSNIYSSLFLVS